MPDRIFTIVESPYKSDSAQEIAENVDYARRCVRDQLQLGRAPFASHLLYTQPGVLRDEVPRERTWGITAGLELARNAKISAFYIDRGLSEGMMLYGLPAALREGRQVEFRTFTGDSDVSEVLNGRDLVALFCSLEYQPIVARALAVIVESAAPAGEG